MCVFGYCLSKVLFISVNPNVVVFRGNVVFFEPTKLKKLLKYYICYCYYFYFYYYYYLLLLLLLLSVTLTVTLTVTVTNVDTGGSKAFLEFGSRLPSRETMELSRFKKEAYLPFENIDFDSLFHVRK